MFLAEQQTFDVNRLVYSGDSGNDMSVLSSTFNAILVNNAEIHIKQNAIELSEKNNSREIFTSQKVTLWD